MKITFELEIEDSDLSRLLEIMTMLKQSAGYQFYEQPYVNLINSISFQLREAIK